MTPQPPDEDDWESAVERMIEDLQAQIAELKRRVDWMERELLKLGGRVNELYRERRGRGGGNPTGARR
jgi:hypothetical protein